MANRQADAEAKGEIDFTRQRDWFNPEDHPNLSVTMIGCGGIGGPTAFNLAKLGIGQITLVDPDVVEAHNIPNQMFKVKDVGRPKVEALKDIVEEFTACEVEPVQSLLQDAEGTLHGIVVSGLDSMKARADLWEMIRFNPRVDLLIDGRIGGQDVVVHTIKPLDADSVEYYEEYCMYTDEEGIEAPCTARGIYDVGTKIASLITRDLRLFVGGEEVEPTVTHNQVNLGVSKFGV